MKAKIFVFWMLAVLAGLVFAPFLPLAPWIFAVLGLSIGIFSFLLMGRKGVFATLFAVGILLLSVSNFQTRESILTHANTAVSQDPTMVNAYVDDLPQTTDFGQKIRFKILSDTAGKYGGFSFYGYTKEYPKLKFGQKISTKIKIAKFTPDNRINMIKNDVIGQANIADFQTIGTENGLWLSFRGLLLYIRQTFNDTIARFLPAAEAGLASGIILGEKALLTPAMLRALQMSGTTHIVALSGYNITIILGLFIIFRNRLSRKIYLFLPLSLIVIFTIMTGAAPSLVRAAIMGILPLLARYIGREGDNIISILFAATLMCILNPFLLLYDVGFQLSFAAFIGIVYLTPQIQVVFRKVQGYLTDTISETLAAQIATLPLISFYFGIVSLVSPIANFIILGLMPVCMLLAFLVGILGIFVPFLGQLIAVPAFFLLHFINITIEALGNLPQAALNLKIENPLWVLLTYFIIIDFWILIRNKVGRERPTI